MKDPSDSAPPQSSTSVPQDQQQTAEAPAPRIEWNDWLETVRALPSEAPDWEGILRFLEGLRQLYEENQRERLTHLREALIGLTTQARERLAYFGMQDASQWTAETCLSTRITDATRLSEQFLTLLLQHHKNDQQRPATREEELSRRQVADELGDEIDRVYGQLAELFAFSPSPEQVSQQRKKEDEHQDAAELPGTSSKSLSETFDDPPLLPQPEEFLSQEDRASASRTEPESIEPRTDDSKPSVAPESVPSAPTPPIPDLVPKPELPAVQAAQESIANEKETPQLAQDEHYEEDSKIPSALPQAVKSRTKEAPPQDSSPFDLDPEQSAQREASEPPPFIPPEVSDSDILLPGGRNSDIQKRAFHLQTTSDPEEWTDLLWTLIAGDALPTAYWLARSLPAMNQPCPVPDWLLAAVQAARWLLPGSQPFVSDLTDIVQNAQPLQDEPQKLLGLSAALRATLLAPNTGIQKWLSVPQICPNLDKIVTPVKTFANWGRSLQPADLRGVADAEQSKESLREATQKAKAWLEEAPERRATLPRAIKVWKHMTGPGGAIRNFLLPVAEDEQEELNTVRENLKHWQSRDHIINHINEIDQQLAGKKARKIDGAKRDRIVRGVQEACGLARCWCECVEREQEIQNGSSPFFQVTSEVRSQIQEALPEVIQSLQELGSPGQHQQIGAAAQCLLRSVEQLQDMFTGQPQPPTHQEEWFTGNATGLLSALGRLLLWLPEIPQEDAGQIAEAALPQVSPALCKAISEGRSLQSAFDTWLTSHDYRFAETILDAFDEANLPAKSRAYQEALGGSREGLRTAVSQTRVAIDRALLEGISPEERSQYEGIIEGIIPAETLYFLPKRKQLERINTQLEEARCDRLKEVQKDWKHLQPQLDKLDNIESIHTFVQSALDRQETLVVEECVAHLTEVVEEGRELEKELFSSPDSRDALREFLDAVPLLEDSLERIGLRGVGKNIKRGSSVAGIKFGEIPSRRRDEADKAIEAWRHLKQQGVNGSRITETVTTLLRYLGFNLESESTSSVRTVQRGTEWAYIQAQMSASYLAKPIPQFGSQNQGRYDIVCVWERPGADMMSAWLRDLHLDTHSVVVFYLGRLTDRQRHDFTRRSRSQELAIAVLDETLLVFLAQERDARLPIFLRCTLPFSAVNPYTPFQAGNVPPEMFFGRSPMARELQRSSGSCLVYGGRQLGKSALLHHVRREFHRPEQEQYAWVADIKLLGGQTGSSPETLWARVRDGLKELKLLKSSINTDKAEKVMEYVQDVMNEKPERRVLMMFDEADYFLDADAKGRFQVVTNLRTLMVATDRRFKVVFAGLHNVQRFQGIPDQPLAHFGTPLLVGPLEPTAARDLVREPLEALGYRFDNPGTVLRILSYTNYHAGLIQLFCQELLKRLHSRQQQPYPLYSIAQSDVENVYLLPHVRAGIRERFNWTLALDRRYQAIVWAMILDQTDAPDGYSQAYDPAYLLPEVQGWWPKGFDKVDTDQLRGLLDEMAGLGVLVRSVSGSYRLRSPNLVRLVGAEADIENRLLALSYEEPDQPFDADSHHALLDEQKQCYSPLTYAQERRLNAAQFGVGLIFASDATGLAHLKAAFRRFIPADLPETKGDYQEIPSTALSDTELQGWLKRYLDSHRNYERLILYCSVQETQVNLLEIVWVARKVCQQHERSKKRWMRLLFVFDPGAAWNWLSLPQQQIQEIEKQVDVVTFPRRWNLSGVGQRLNQGGKMESDDVCRSVLEATGGWSSLLDVLFERCGDQDDPRPTAKAIKKDLADPRSELSRRFIGSLDLHGSARKILKFIKTLREDGQEVPIELIAPENIDGSPVLSQDECYATLEYLQRMGCIDLRGTLLSVEPTVLRLI